MSSNSELHVKSGEVNAKRNSHEAIAVNDVRINIKENNNNPKYRWIIIMF